MKRRQDPVLNVDHVARSRRAARPAATDPLATRRAPDTSARWQQTAHPGRATAVGETPAASRARSVRTDQERTWASMYSARLKLLAVAGDHGELVGALRFSGSVWVAAVESEEGESGQRSCAKRVVVELIGEVDRHTRMALSPRHPLREAPEITEPPVQQRLERSVPCRVFERLFEERDRALRSLQLGEEDERLGARCTRRVVSQELEGDRPGTSSLSRSEVGTRGGERAPVTVLRRARGRRAQGVLPELRRGDRSAACDRQRRPPPRAPRRSPRPAQPLQARDGAHARADRRRSRPIVRARGADRSAKRPDRARRRAAGA